MVARRRWAAVQRRAGAAAGCLAAVLLTGCSVPSGAAQAPTGASSSVDAVGVTVYPVQDRLPAPALSGTGLDGRLISLASFGRGKIVVLNVWASWCGPCRTESPALARVAKTFATRGVQFLGLDEQDPAAAARAFVASAGSTYPHLVDKDGSLLRTLRLLPQMGIPSTLVIDRQGRMAARVIGPVTEAEITTIIRGLKKES